MSYFYQDEGKKIIKEELLTEDAKKKAELFAGRNMTRNQIRRFFHDVKSLEAKVGENGENFIRMKPIIMMLKSKAAYAASRVGGQQRIPDEFKDFIEESVDNIKNFDDFKAFCLRFEAIVGFFYEKARR